MLVAYSSGMNVFNELNCYAIVWCKDLIKQSAWDHMWLMKIDEDPFHDHVSIVLNLEIK